MSCAPGTLFDPISSRCDHSYKVKCTQIHEENHSKHVHNNENVRGRSPDHGGFSSQNGKEQESDPSLVGSILTVIGTKVCF